MTVILPFLDQLTPCGDFMPCDEHAGLHHFDLAYG
jgi:hypothetical protein